MILLLAAAAADGLGGVLLPPSMHEGAIAVIDCIYREQFRESEDEARKLIRRFPAHPAGYFFMAASVDSWMAARKSDKRENEFYRYCDLAIEKGEELLEINAKNEWARFFIGGAEGFKGTYEARYERWITAFRSGWKGVSILMRLRESNSGIEDIDFGIGCYEYWRSALMKVLWWMPGVKDKRAEGIAKLERTRREGTYTRTGASLSVIEIYLNERRHDDALRVAEEVLAQYPLARAFLFCKVRALYGLKRYEEGQAVCRVLLARLESMAFEEGATIALCHFWMAKGYLALGQGEECLAALRQMRRYPFDKHTKKLMSRYFDEASEMKKQASAMRRRDAGAKVAAQRR